MANWNLKKRDENDEKNPSFVTITHIWVFPQNQLQSPCWIFQIPLRSLLVSLHDYLQHKAKNVQITCKLFFYTTIHPRIQFSSTLQAPYWFFQNSTRFLKVLDVSFNVCSQTFFSVASNFGSSTNPVNMDRMYMGLNYNNYSVFIIIIGRIVISRTRLT